MSDPLDVHRRLEHCLQAIQAGREAMAHDMYDAAMRLGAAEMMLASASYAVHKHAAAQRTWSNLRVAQRDTWHIVFSSNNFSLPAEYLHLSEGGRHRPIKHRSARSVRPHRYPLPAESCGARRGFSRRDHGTRASRYGILGRAAR
jgi:hypothetical protein